MKKISAVVISRPRLKIKTYDLDGQVSGEIELPTLFSADIRPDLIRRAYLSEFTASLQPKGRDPMAGKRTSAESLGVGRGLARVPRIKNSIRAALVNSVVGGRLAHPPRVEKVLKEYINRREKVLATISAIAATANVDLVAGRGHLFDKDQVPIIVDDNVLNGIKTTSEARKFLRRLGIYQDVERAMRLRRIRAGKGKMRGRKYKTPKSVLFVLPDNENSFALSLRNLPGVDIATPASLNVMQLAPGGVPGRLAVYTPLSLKGIEERFARHVVFVSL